jgi:hypothetical protein
MNTNGLARQYDKLTPRERLPLILAASARGDEQERDRLGASAPRVLWRVADYFGLGLAHLEISHLHFMELLDHAALLFETLMATDTPEDKYSKRLLGVAQTFGFVFKTKLAGWRLFCREQNLDPELCWSCLPGFRTLKRAEKLADCAAFERDGAAAFLADAKADIGKVAGELITPESVAAELRHCFAVRAEWWG